jgi:hypothetical protein
MSFKFGILVQRIKNLVPHARAKLQAQTAELESQLSNQELIELPRTNLISLNQQIEQLAPPPAYCQSIQTELAEAIARWQENPNAPNYLFVLSRPIEPIDQTIMATLADLQDLGLELKPISWSARPHRYNQIYTKLKQEITPLCQPETAASTQMPAPSEEADRPALIVIPNLSWCFLRCVDGLQGVNYLSTTILSNRSRFWLVGCNSWAWHYFHHIYNWQNCFSQTITLPKLSEVELKAWLTPVRQVVETQYGNDQDDAGPTEAEWLESQDEWRSKAEKRYFEQLADLALGSGAIAAALWLRSLRLQQIEPEEEPESDSTNPPDRTNQTSQKSKSLSQEQSQDATVASGDRQPQPTTVLVAKSKSVPELPILSKDDYYLLFSLGLHGGMNLADLAISLSEPESKILTQIEALGQAGLVERDRQLFRLSAAFYPRLHGRLINNKILFAEAI